MNKVLWLFCSCKSTGSGRSFWAHNFQSEVFNHSSKQFYAVPQCSYSMALGMGQYSCCCCFAKMYYYRIRLSHCHSNRTRLLYKCARSMRLFEHTIRKSVGSKTTLSSRNSLKIMLFFLPYCTTNVIYHSFAFYFVSACEMPQVELFFFYLFVSCSEALDVTAVYR